MNKPRVNNKILSHIITYERSRLIGFDMRGMPLYEVIKSTHVVYACSEKELKKRVTEWQTYLTSDTYIFHRHPRKYVEVVG